MNVCQLPGVGVLGLAGPESTSHVRGAIIKKQSAE